ncbi:MAG: hypothetical protein AAGU18_14150 [Proteiniphilum sp.]
MKMILKIAVTDACIFIDLFDIDLITSFFGLELEVHTTSGVYFELNNEQQLVLKAYQSVNKLVIHNLRLPMFCDPLTRAGAKRGKLAALKQFLFLRSLHAMGAPPNI